MDQIDLTPRDAADAARLRAAYEHGYVVGNDIPRARNEVEAELWASRSALSVFPDPPAPQAPAPAPAVTLYSVGQELLNVAEALEEHRRWRELQGPDVDFRSADARNDAACAFIRAVRAAMACGEGA